MNEYEYLQLTNTYIQTHVYMFILILFWPSLWQVFIVIICYIAILLLLSLLQVVNIYLSECKYLCHLRGLI